MVPKLCINDTKKEQIYAIIRRTLITFYTIQVAIIK